MSQFAPTWTASEDRGLVQLIATGTPWDHIPGFLRKPAREVSDRLMELRRSGEYSEILREVKEADDLMSSSLHDMEAKIEMQRQMAMAMGQPVVTANQWNRQDHLTKSQMPRIPNCVVDDIVLQFTNEGQFYADVVNLRHYAGDYRQGMYALVEKWMKKCWPSDWYRDGHGDRYMLTRELKAVITGDILSSYRDNFERGAAEVADDERIVNFLMEQEDTQYTGVYVLQTWRTMKKRVPVDWVRHQVERQLGMDECYASIGLVMARDAHYMVALSDEDMRCVSKLFRARVEMHYLGRTLDGEPTAEYVGQEVISDEYTSLTDHNHERSMSLGDEDMKADFDKDSVLETGAAHKKEHAELRVKIQQAAEKAVAAYVADVVQAVVKGESLKAQKPLGIQLALVDQSKKYDDCLLLVRHVSGDTVPSSDEVTFLLAAAEDNTPTSLKCVSLSMS